MRDDGLADPKPFVRTTTAYEILDSLKRYCGGRT
jgi:hypothetical protein